MIGETIVVLAVSGAVYGVVRRRNAPATGPSVRRPSTRSRGSSGQLPKKSWLVKAYNASGAAPIEGDTLHDATAELAGRAVGATVRTPARMARGSRSLTGRTFSATKRLARRHQKRVSTRWESEPSRPMFVWRRESTPSEQASSATATPGAVGGDDGDRPLTGKADCPRCGRPQKATIPADKADITVTCLCGHRITFWRAPPDDPPPETRSTSQPAGVPAPPAPTSGDTKMTTPTRLSAAPRNSDLTTKSTSGGWAALLGVTADFVPEDDAALIAFMTEQGAGITGLAEAFEQVRENCVNQVGLDPNAVAGMEQFSEAASQAAATIAQGLAQFLAVYEEIRQAVANGVVMPYNGRFFTGAAS